ncbi:class II aldolase/adducin family protein [Amycolatopsis rhabdoformis]|uniref:Class II aldolase/adducin family protein n=1 Tax=Amycolatopsis rhabdoformis TaxID=1448059 RepID=A0ABZ1IGP9_9PSEU|nr:class II aldolase/adducin family protein [Amycolatopsis rhabdoformis]WSE33646.1 class II aldolase/adducin family protein [Amycolatopsis rhabdoformis]
MRESVALACRVLAATGLVEHVLGHISVRTSPDELLVRCRGPRESGLRYTTAEDIRPVPLHGRPDAGEWSVPNELPIHTEVLRRHPDVTAVVHAHPPAVVTMSLAGLPWLPLFGAYDIPAARLAADGIPVWPRSVLVNDHDLAGRMADALGERPVLVLSGHGLVSVAGGDPETAVAQAVLQAMAVDSLARHTLALVQAGGKPVAIPDEDLALLPDLGGAFTVATMWRHVVRRTENP